VRRRRREGECERQVERMEREEGGERLAARGRRSEGCGERQVVPNSEGGDGAVQVKGEKGTV
jgi:hypothetical protein